jgi:hypothetical protein
MQQDVSTVCPAVSPVTHPTSQPVGSHQTPSRYLKPSVRVDTTVPSGLRATHTCFFRSNDLQQHRCSCQSLAKRFLVDTVIANQGYAEGCQLQAGIAGSWAHPGCA